MPEAFGITSFAASFSGYFVMLANLGMPIYAMRTCAEKKNDRNSLVIAFNELWSISIILSAISFTAYISMILLIPKLRSNAILLAIYGSSIIFQMLGCEWLYRGLEKFRFLALSSLVCKVISLLCILIFVRSTQDIYYYAIFSVLTSFGSNVISFFMLHKYVDISFHININLKHFKPLLIFFIMSCAVYVYSSLDLTMLGFIKSDYDTGLYSLASKGKTVLTMTGALVWSSTLPLATNLWKKGDKKQFESLATKSIVIVSSLQLSLSVICIIFAREIIILVGGTKYLDCVPSFRILLLSLVPIGASNILGGQVLIPAGKENRLLIAEILGAGFNFVANLILIPKYSIMGAAVSTVIAEVIVWFICIYYAKKDLNIDFFIMPIYKTILGIISRCYPIIIKANSIIAKGKLHCYCPCCNTYMGHFVDGGYLKHPEMYNPIRYQKIDQNIICPICRSLPRHRVLVSWMDENIDHIKNARILHFAQEKSLRMWMRRNHISCTTADLFNPADLKIDIQDTRLNDESYDLIICNHVLEHVTDYKKALAELYRIVKPGGNVIISFPVDLSLSSVYEDKSIVSEEDRILHFGQNDHLRLFGKDSTEILKDAGFSVSEINGDSYDTKIRPEVGPADYDYNVLWCLSK